MRTVALASAAIAAFSFIAPSPLSAMPVASSAGAAGEISLVKKTQYYYRPHYYRPYYYRGYGYPYYRPYGSCWGCGWPYGG